MADPTLVERYLPAATLENLRRADRDWDDLRHGRLYTPKVIASIDRALDETESKGKKGKKKSNSGYDVTICGGTLGILLGAVLAQRGWKVLLLERGKLRGRDQEWNISRKELREFVELGLLTDKQLETAIVTEYNPARVGFHGHPDLWIEGVLNVGVDPVYLLDTLRKRFIKAGGELCEGVSFGGALVHPDGVTVKVSADGEDAAIETRLLIDAMGHRSPIVAHARDGAAPDSICMVVGSCATGYSEEQNKTGDLMVSNQPIANRCQYFWEAFPARDGRTTYLFTYLDPQPDRFSLESFAEEYLRLLPDYQGVELDDLDFKRFLFGVFPAYRDSPVRLPWDRVLAVGDSSGGQSPLSFGGFGAMVRHLSRLDRAIDDALRSDTLDRASLQLVQPYQPNIAVTWLFQQTMTVPLGGSEPDPDAVNRLLGSVFGAMAQGGDRVLKPFLQDVVQFGCLFEAMARATVAAPLTVVRVLPQVGLGGLLDWTRHFLGLGLYGALSAWDARAGVSERVEKMGDLPPERSFALRRWLEALRYGSGGDYHDE
ncbi:MAG: NAD(P)/FAD-dependent oxidoreductase [Geitlerinemataceae cyanobacterium]